ncbi:hypothetical protein ACGF5F_33060 [Streptomyces sp. NPDC047821]|uniref:hypothetical protein n=1 Tax=Streptomyces sp. NPDC047821 TaxID=3365488 RepID=UPI00372157C5
MERAVYFCAAEVLTNVAEHSGAHAVELTETTADGRIRLVVRDDGRGGARAGVGTGLTGLGERLAAVDGARWIESPSRWAHRGHRRAAEAPVTTLAAALGEVGESALTRQLSASVVRRPGLPKTCAVRSASAE